MTANRTVFSSTRGVSFKFSLLETTARYCYPFL